MLRRGGAALMLLVVLAGCGGKPQPQAEEPTPDAPEQPTLAEGEVATDALREFECRRDDDGVWTASGAVKNTAKASASYQLAVLVSDTEAGNATTRVLRSIQPGESVDFTLGELPATGENPTCRVTVVRLAR